MIIGALDLRFKGSGLEPLLVIMLCSLARPFPFTVHIPTTLNQGGGGGGRGLIINGYRHISGEPI